MTASPEGAGRTPLDSPKNRCGVSTYQQYGCLWLRLAERSDMSDMSDKSDLSDKMALVRREMLFGRAKAPLCGKQRLGVLALGADKPS